jgi:hypothetical protein
MPEQVAIGHRILIRKLILDEDGKYYGKIFVPKTAESDGQSAKANVFYGILVSKGALVDSDIGAAIPEGAIIAYHRDSSFPHYSLIDGKEYRAMLGSSILAWYKDLDEANIKTSEAPLDYGK